MSSTLTARVTSYLLAGAAIALVLSGPAHAASSTESHADARKDLVSRDRFSDALPHTLDPSRRLGDITMNDVAYGTGLVVTTRFLNLQNTGHQEFHWSIRTSDDDYAWDASYVINPGQAKGRFTLLDPIGFQPRCGGVTLDRPKRLVTLTIPAACLGAPDWVRVGNGVVFQAGSREYHDDARLDGAVKDGWKYGPKLVAG
jgi:hypothetical protein